jgi:hypothetical protein
MTQRGAADDLPQNRQLPLLGGEILKRHLRLGIAWNPFLVRSK